MKLIRDILGMGLLGAGSAGSDNDMKFPQTNIQLSDWLQLLSPLWILSWNTAFSLHFLT